MDVDGALGAVGSIEGSEGIEGIAAQDAQQRDHVAAQRQDDVTGEHVGGHQPFLRVLPDQVVQPARPGRRQGPS